MQERSAGLTGKYVQEAHARTQKRKREDKRKGDEEEFFIERIKDHRFKKKAKATDPDRMEYLVAWQHYPESEDDTWEDQGHVADTEQLTAYLKEYPDYGPIELPQSHPRPRGAQRR